jgi:hypothetical protein
MRVTNKSRQWQQQKEVYDTCILVDIAVLKRAKCQECYIYS